MDRNSNGIPDDCEQGTFRRGDVVVDGALDLSDAIQILGFLVLGNRLEGCPDAADADDDGQVGITDPLRLLRSLFLGDGPLPPPHACGLDPTNDHLPACHEPGC